LEESWWYFRRRGRFGGSTGGAANGHGLVGGRWVIVLNNSQKKRISICLTL